MMPVLVMQQHLITTTLYDISFDDAELIAPCNPISSERFGRIDDLEMNVHVFCNASNLLQGVECPGVRKERIRAHAENLKDGKAYLEFDTSLSGSSAKETVSFSSFLLFLVSFHCASWNLNGCPSQP